MQNRQMNQIPTDRDARRTVIPTPRSDAMFAGWGVKF
jgi:hypothetical protein